MPYSFSTHHIKMEHPRDLFLENEKLKEGGLSITVFQTIFLYMRNFLKYLDEVFENQYSL